MHFIYTFDYFSFSTAIYYMSHFLGVYRNHYINLGNTFSSNYTLRLIKAIHGSLILPLHEYSECFVKRSAMIKK